LPSSPMRQTIRARYENGALHPESPLDIPEGAELEIEIRPKK
jgi:predicted DNA-binding antitoxin AbrB/MazE fold protein